MPMELRNSETAQNLMRAFAGESQARNRYDQAAAICRKQGLPVLEYVFRFTAEQERVHAKLFWEQLRPLTGESVTIQGGYPAEATEDPAALLRFARHDEYEEHGSVYPAFGDTAAREGFAGAASAFRQIAAIEKIHGDRFARFGELLETGTLFVSDVKTGWMCLKCGHVQEGLEAPKHCPVCQHEQGWFIRLELAPWTPGGIR